MFSFGYVLVLTSCSVMLLLFWICFCSYMVLFRFWFLVLLWLRCGFVSVLFWFLVLVLSGSVLVRFWFCSGSVLVLSISSFLRIILFFYWFLYRYFSESFLVLFWLCSGPVLVLFWLCSGSALILFYFCSASFLVLSSFFFSDSVLLYIPRDYIILVWVWLYICCIWLLPPPPPPPTPSVSSVDSSLQNFMAYSGQELPFPPVERNRGGRGDVRLEKKSNTAVLDALCFCSNRISAGTFGSSQEAKHLQYPGE